jgi:hypothetical protein
MKLIYMVLAIGLAGCAFGQWTNPPGRPTDPPGVTPGTLTELLTQIENRVKKPTNAWANSYVLTTYDGGTTTVAVASDVTLAPLFDALSNRVDGLDTDIQGLETNLAGFSNDWNSAVIAQGLVNTNLDTSIQGLETDLAGLSNDWTSAVLAQGAINTNVQLQLTAIEAGVLTNVGFGLIGDGQAIALAVDTSVVATGTPIYSVAGLATGTPLYEIDLTGGGILGGVYAGGGNQQPVFIGDICGGALRQHGGFGGGGCGAGGN